MNFVDVDVQSLSEFSGLWPGQLVGLVLFEEILFATQTGAVCCSYVGWLCCPRRKTFSKKATCVHNRISAHEILVKGLTQSVKLLL